MTIEGCNSARNRLAEVTEFGRGPIANLKLKVQLYSGEEIAMGPGKADLLDAIEREGSISAAARSMGMSYRRAWMLVDAMNRSFAEPLVETHPGGGREAGAKVTETGHRLRAAYRELVGQAEAGTRGRALETLTDALRG